MQENKMELLTKKGKVNYTGFAKKVVMPFNKQHLRPTNKLKEWDNYVIQDGRFFVSLTILNLSYMSEVRAIIVDLEQGFVYKRVSRNFNKNSVVLASDFRKGVSDCKTNDANFRFETRNGVRVLKGYFKNFYRSQTFTGDLEFEFRVHDEPDESIVSSHNFKDRTHFIYSQKVNDLKVDGTITVNGKMYSFDKNLTFASCTLARGVMPYSTEWEISSLNSKDRDGNLIAFNLGRIVGKGDKVEENVIFYNGKIEKVGNIKVYNCKQGFKQSSQNSWTYYSDDGKLELYFEPIKRIKQGSNLFLFNNKTNVILGLYSGKLTLDNKHEVDIERVLGFAECVKNKW